MYYDDESESSLRIDTSCSFPDVPSSPYRETPPHSPVIPCCLRCGYDPLGMEDYVFSKFPGSMAESAITDISDFMNPHPEECASQQSRSSLFPEPWEVKQLPHGTLATVRLDGLLKEDLQIYVRDRKMYIAVRNEDNIDSGSIGGHGDESSTYDLPPLPVESNNVLWCFDVPDHTQFNRIRALFGRNGTLSLMFPNDRLDKTTTTFIDIM